MGFKKGKPKTGGRTKETPNKLTKTVKELVLDVFNKVQDHPKANLYNFAIDNPKDFYVIASKLIPSEVDAKVQQSVIKVVRE